MKKNFAMLTIIIVLGLALTGCASPSQPATAVPDSAADGSTNLAAQSPDQLLQNKLAAGTLKLEGSPQAVTAEQAKTLLPLWKAVKSLSASDTASPDEITALYQQIEESMTSEQVLVLQDMTIAPDDLQALMKQYNITAPEGPQNGGPAISEDQRATMMALRESGAAGGGPGEFPGGGAGGGPGGGPGGGMVFRGGSPPEGAVLPDGVNPQGGTIGQGNTGSMPRMRAMGGMNALWLDPLIQLLTERAG